MNGAVVDMNAGTKVDIINHTPRGCSTPMLYFNMLKQLSNQYQLNLI